jgi:hypothetical protein
MRSILPPLALLSLLPLSLAAPAPQPAAVPIATSAPSLENVPTLEERQLLSDILPGVLNNVGALLKDVNSLVQPTAILSVLQKIQPTARPTNIEQAVSWHSSVWVSPTPRTDFFPAVATQVANGLFGNTLNTALKGGLPVGENSINNNNPKPPRTIYPKKENGDAPYTISEDALRRAIFIPSSFTYGVKPPTIFVPGTASYGGIVFGNNLRKLLNGKPYADPVWLNIPGALLADAQGSSEYIAYAINYISAISKNSNKISVITWSQGGLDTQWAFKYWPSTRKVVRDFLPVSPDFKGTILANGLCLAASSDRAIGLCPPAIIQQEATSDFVRALRSAGGDSAYVPTTTFYSGFFDEIVEPQQGTGASGFINDVRGVGVSNNEVQRVCSGRLAGSFYGHAGVLFNPLTFALIVDALQNDGPGNVNRINLASVCNSYAAPGLDLDDVLATMGLIPVAGALVLTFPQKMFNEPALRSFAI